MSRTATKYNVVVARAARTDPTYVDVNTTIISYHISDVLDGGVATDANVGLSRGLKSSRNFNTRLGIYPR